MEKQHTHGGARPGAGRKSADRIAALAFGVDLIVQLAIAQERVALYLKQPERDPTVGPMPGGIGLRSHSRPHARLRRHELGNG